MLNEDLELEYLSPAALRPYEGNARRHSKRQLRKLADGIRANGWINPIIIDETNMILAGAGRWEVADMLHLKRVPVIRKAGLSPEQKRGYMLADNRLHDESSFDRTLLKIELSELAIAGFELELTGFNTLEIDTILSLDAHDSTEDEPAVNLPDEHVIPVSRVGDLWHIGPHRLLNGDARDPEAYERLLDGERAQMIFTDPPYGCRIEGNVSGLGKVRHQDFVMGAGEVSLQEFGQTLLRPALRCMAQHVSPGTLAFVCTDWRAAPFLHDAAQGVFHEQKNLIVWAKTNAGMGTLYRSGHELIHLWKVTPGAHINNFGLGEGGRHRSNVWTYAGANTFRHGRMEDLADHSTVKPLKLVADAILDCSRRNGIVLDPFAGSGTTLFAAEQTGRRGFGIELDPKYVDVILRRVSEATGCVPLLDGVTPLDEVAKLRRKGADL